MSLILSNLPWFIVTDLKLHFLFVTTNVLIFHLQSLNLWMIWFLHLICFLFSLPNNMKLLCVSFSFTITWNILHMQLSEYIRWTDDLCLQIAVFSAFCSVLQNFVCCLSLPQLFIFKYLSSEAMIQTRWFWLLSFFFYQVCHVAICHKSQPGYCWLAPGKRY